MGATVRPREFDADQPSQTEQLSNWISKVRSKKIMCRRNRKRDLRIEAVLASVLSKAEHELRNKQMSRIMRWQQMKQRLLDDFYYKDGGCTVAQYKDGGNCENDSSRLNSYGVISSSEQYNAWNGPLCPELRSLDSFMCQLNEIKVPLQR